MDNHIVIMAGGIGSRLWPLSTPEYPKQFIDVLGIGKSLLRLTVERFLPLAPIENFWIVTSEAYEEKVRTQLPEIPSDHILLEPEARGTAPCIAYACWKIAARCPDANVVITPSDAFVYKTDLFAELVGKALEYTSSHNDIVTVGIRPTRPETGYGYIHTASAQDGIITKVASFVEKPDRTKAEMYLAEGNYLWNAGIFVWNVNTIKEQMMQYSPQIADIMEEISISIDTFGEKAVLAKLFPQCEKISIDYAVMEKSDSIYVIAGDLGWSDLGSWSSLKDHMEADEEGNSVVGQNIRMIGCKDTVVHMEGLNKVVVEGLEGYVLAYKNGNLLICRRENEQKVRDYSK